MPTIRLFILAFAFSLTTLSNLCAGELQAGAARADITPPVGGPMWGFFDRKDNPTVGIRDPLQARALVLSTGAERMALVSLDLGRAPTRDITNSLRTRLKAAVGIEHIFLVGSHTHCGPVLERAIFLPKSPMSRSSRTSSSIWLWQPPKLCSPHAWVSARRKLP